MPPPFSVNWLAPFPDAVFHLPVGSTSMNIEIVVFTEPGRVRIELFENGVTTGAVSQSDGQGIGELSYAATPGVYVFTVKAGDPGDTIESTPTTVTVLAYTAPTFITITAPTDGSTYTAAEGGIAYPIDVAGMTDPVQPVRIFLDGGTTAWSGTSREDGTYLIPTQIPIGDHTIQAVAGTATGSVSSNTVLLHILPFPVATPSLLTDETFTYYMNWVANLLGESGNPDNQVPLYTATYAANSIAGTKDMTLVGALNQYFGNPPGQWRTVNELLNFEAGTTDLSNIEALYQICLRFVPPLGGGPVPLGAIVSTRPQPQG